MKNTSFSLRPLIAATLLAASMSATAYAQTPQRVAPVPAEATAIELFDGGIRRALSYGIYEVAYSAATDSIYVASAESSPNVKGGQIFKLDPRTLETTGLTHTDKKNFALTTNPAGDTLYVTNSLQSGISAIDLKTGDVKGHLKFENKASDGTPYGPRQVIYQQDGDLLYVGGVGAPGVIWVVDAKTLKLVNTIENAGKWVTGLLIDPEAKRLYSANGDGEVLVIDSEKHTILERWHPQDGRKFLLLNLALDKKTHRLFVTDNSEAKTVLVFDTRTGKVQDELKVGDAMGIKLNPIRNELYITHRMQGTVSVLDATTYKVLKTYNLPINPNSLAIDPTGQVLYVTIKTPFNKDYSASGRGSIARIDLSEIKK